MQDAANLNDGQQQDAQQQPQAPMFDAAAMQGMIQQGIQTSLQQIEQQRQQQAAEEQRRQQAQQQGEDPVAKLMNPYLQPMAIQTQSAVDAATFYTGTNEAVRYKDEIEAVHQNWLQRGILVNRGEVWKYVKGNHLDEIMQEKQRMQEQAAQEAQQAAALGAGMQRQMGGNQKHPSQMSSDELAAFLEGASF